MALSLQSIGNFLFKRAQSKSSTNDGRQFFEETFDGRAPVIPAQLWAQADQIPVTAPTLADQVVQGVVKRWAQLQLTAVPGTTNAFQSDSLRNCIPFNFATDGTYNYALFDSTGASIPFGQGDWLVDPAVGTVTFYGAVPGNMPPKISFFQYVGTTGMVSINPSSLTFTQIATPPNAPASGYQTVFIGTDGKAKTIDSTGAIKALGGGAAGGASGKNYLSDFYDGSAITGITSYNQAVSYTINSGDNKVDTLGDAINYTACPYATGQAINYNRVSGTTDIGGLTNGTQYFAVKLTANIFGLATTIDNAMAKRLIDLTSQGSGSFRFASATTGVSSGVGDVSAGLTQSVNTTLPIRNPSNLRLSKDAANRIGMNWVIPFIMDRADVDITRPMKIAFKFRSSANFTSLTGFNDATVQLYDVDNNIVPQLDGLYLQPLPVALTTTGLQFSFMPSAGGYNYRFIVSIENVNANAFDLDFADLEISSAAGQVPGAFMTPFTITGTNVVTATTTAPTKGTVVVDTIGYSRQGDEAHIIGALKMSAAGTNGSGDYLFQLPAGLMFDLSKVPASQVNGGQQSDFSTVGLGTAGFTNNNASAVSGKVIPYDAARFRLWGEQGIVGGGTATIGFHGSNLFAWNEARAVHFDFKAPIAGWGASATYSNLEIALKQVPLTATSNQITGLNTGVWIAHTGNSLVLQPGLYDLTGTIAFDNNGTNPAFTAIASGWFGANGANTGTVPASLASIPGVTVFGQASTINPINNFQINTAYYIHPAMPLTIRVTQPTTVYLVCNASGTALGNGRAAVIAIANKRPDYSAFGVYNQQINSTYGLTASVGLGANAVLKMTALLNDPLGCYDVTTGYWKCPANGAGQFRVSMTTQGTSASNLIWRRVTPVAGPVGLIMGVTTSILSGTMSFTAKAGETYGVFTDSNPVTLSGFNASLGYLTQLTIERTGM